MDSNSKIQLQSKGLKRALLLLAPVWLCVVIEVIGAWRFSKDPYSLKYAIDLGRLRDPLVTGSFFLSVLSPVLVLAAFAFLDRHTLPKSKYATTLLVLIITLLLGMSSCMWSCSGHPTWTSGYK